LRAALSQLQTGGQVPCRNRAGSRGVETREMPTNAAPFDLTLIVAAAARHPACDSQTAARRRRVGRHGENGSRSAIHSRAAPVANATPSRFGRRPRSAGLGASTVAQVCSKSGGACRGILFKPRAVNATFVENSAPDGGRQGAGRPERG